MSGYSQSAWPKVHQNQGNTQHSPFPGIHADQNVKIQTLFDNRLGNTLGVYTDSNGALWGSSQSHVFKLAADDVGDLEVVDAIMKPLDITIHDVFHGIYSFVDDNDVFYTYAANEIYSFVSENEGDAHSSILMQNKYIIDYEDDRVLSLGIDAASSDIIFVTDQGRLGSIDQDSGEVNDLVQLTGDVTNTMAQSADGSLIILTSEALDRVRYTGSQFEIIWSVSYEKAADYVNRVSGSGSGTSPSIMTLEDGREFVVIADGKVEQSVAVYDLIDGSLLATAPVVFGDDPESNTEQSIAVKGDRFVVVQNALSWVGKRVSQMLEGWNVPQSAQTYNGVPSRIQENVLLAPVIMGDSNLGGFVQFKFDPDLLEEERLSVTWSSERSCPNAIPVIDSDEGLYCVGKVNVFDRETPALGFGGVWAIEKQNWMTGALEGTFELGLNLNYNSNYAATQIIGPHKMLYGCLGGIVYLREE